MKELTILISLIFLEELWGFLKNIYIFLQVYLCMWCMFMCLREKRKEKRWKEKKRKIFRLPFPSSIQSKALGIRRLKEKRGTIFWAAHKQRTFNHQIKLAIPVLSAVSQEINSNVGKYFLWPWMHLLSHCLSWISLRCSMERCQNVLEEAARLCFSVGPVQWIWGVSVRSWELSYQQGKSTELLC